MPPVFSERSRRYLDVLPNTAPLACSTAAGWTSLRAQHSLSAGLCDAYDTHLTPDQSIVVVTRGAVDVDAFGNGRSTMVQPSGRSPTPGWRALEHMSANLHEALDLDAIAAEAGASKYQFVRLFRERTGATPIRCLTNLRLDKAARLLATTDLPIGRAAFECGYPNVTHFNGAFRRRYGATPGDHRRRH